MVDSETGELLAPLVPSPLPKNHGDSETGEQAQSRLVYQRSKFKVPRSALTQTVFDTPLLASKDQTKQTLCPDLTLLILPLLMFLPGWGVVLYILAETLYHHCSHHNQGHEYKPLNTPLRLFFDYKCAECVSRIQMEKVGRLQDVWSLKVNTRRILNCNYAKLCSAS